MSAVPHTPWSRLVVIAIGLAAVVGVVITAFLWPSVTATVRDLPLALAGPAAQTAQVERALEERSAGTFDFVEASDRDDAVRLIETRKVYGAIVLGERPEVLTATAANSAVAQILGALQPALQAQLTAALTAQGVPPSALPKVLLTDVVPLSSSDPRGSTLGASSFPLVLGGMLGGILTSLLIVGVWRRVAAVLVYSAVGGAGIAGILQGWFGGLQGDYLTNAAAVALTLLAISGTIIGVVSIVGRSGVAVGPIVFLLFANPISAAALPVEFLVHPWGAIGQWLPPGAAATLLRDLSYFPLADVSFPWLVLGAWSVGALVLTAVGHFKDRGAATRAAVREASASA